MSDTHDITDEQWRPVLSFEGLYEASSLGRVRRMGGTASTRTDRVLKQFPGRKGYWRVRLSSRGVGAQLFVSRIVWQAFNGPIRDGFQINHINGIKTDNRLVNLEAVTPGENTQHAYRTGLSSSAILTANQVKEIRRFPLRYYGYRRDLAARYGVTRQAIGDIMNGKRWSHLYR